jgi:hypothetical protein
MEGCQHQSAQDHAECIGSGPVASGRGCVYEIVRLARIELKLRQLQAGTALDAPVMARL